MKKTNTSMMWVVIKKVSKELSKTLEISLENALEFIYNSKFYKILEIDDNKLWYYSNKYLTDFLIEEYKTGNFNLSEKV